MGFCAARRARWRGFISLRQSPHKNTCCLALAVTPWQRVWHSKPKNLLIFVEALVERLKHNWAKQFGKSPLCKSTRGWGWTRSTLNWQILLRCLHRLARAILRLHWRHEKLG